MNTPSKTWKLAIAGLIAASCAFSSATFARDYRHDHDNNPPGPRGGPGTNWENPPGPRGGPGASPDRRHWNDHYRNARGHDGGYRYRYGDHDRYRYGHTSDHRWNDHHDRRHDSHRWNEHDDDHHHRH